MPNSPRLLLAALLLPCLACATPAPLPVPLAEPEAAPAAIAPSGGQTLQQQWESATPAQRRDLRDRYAAWRALDDGERARIRAAAARLAMAPEGERQVVHARFDALDRLHRDGWRLGPELGALYPALQPLFGYLPPAEREPVLALLRGLDREQRAELALLSQRTPPTARAELRQQLLAQPAQRRGTWIRQRLGP